MILCCSFYLVKTLFNAAPGQSGLGEEFFTNTDILCVNETEVSVNNCKMLQLNIEVLSSVM